MVSFVCDACQDTVKKAKFMQHFKRFDGSLILL